MELYMKEMVVMCEQIEINVPTCFALNELSTLGTVLHPSNTDIGFLVAGEHFHTVSHSKPIVRIYLMNLVDGKFEVTQELESIKFDSTPQAKQIGRAHV